MGADVAEEHGAVSTEARAARRVVGDAAGGAAYGRVRGERFPGHLPASTAVGVAGLIGGALVEIDAIAFIAGR